MTLGPRWWTTLFVGTLTALCPVAALLALLHFFSHCCTLPSAYTVEAERGRQGSGRGPVHGLQGSLSLTPE